MFLIQNLSFSILAILHKLDYYLYATFFTQMIVNSFIKTAVFVWMVFQEYWNQNNCCVG